MEGRWGSFQKQVPRNVFNWGDGRILERYKNVASCMDIVGNGVVWEKISLLHAAWLCCDEGLLLT